MGNDYKREARKQYLHYFRVWFIIVGVMAVVLAAVLGVNAVRNSSPRPNDSAPAERVYDYANVLTAEEEEKLRSQIAKAEKRLHMDIVIVTIDESVEGEEAREKYGSPYWEDNMETWADDFWDNNGYGYNKKFEGDGVLLLHNWYEGQNGEHMSTSGRAEQNLSSYDIDQILYTTVDRYYDRNLYRAYSEFVDAVVETLDSRYIDSFYWMGVPVLSTIVAAIYAFVCLKQTKVKDTTAVNAYVVGGKPLMRVQRDDFLRKHVTRRHIERSSSSGGGGHSGGGGGGHHHSSSGASHGGGSHRH